jgi:hypothetical protein
MTARDDLDRQLAAWFDADAAAREPEHLLGQVLARTARTRRRPAWLVPERWFPMSAISTRSAAAPRVPWRFVGMAALLILALVAGAALIVGTQRRELPPPFGRAANGLVAYSSGGDIYTVDPVSGASAAVVTGPETDVDPVYSLDGTQLAFRREGSPGQVVVAKADGSDVHVVASGLMIDLLIAGFSPDGTGVLLAYNDGDRAVISVASTDGSGNMVMQLPFHAFEPTFQPPDGKRILFVSANAPDGPAGTSTESGLYTVAADGSDLRPIIPTTPGRFFGGPRYSPDGTRIAYAEWSYDPSRLTVQGYVMAADGTGARRADPSTGAQWTWVAAWSNDGTRLLALRGYGSFYEEVRAVVLPADGSSEGTEISVAGAVNQECCSVWSWAPDDSVILGAPTDTTGSFTGHLVVDPATGTSHPASWPATSSPAWQRIAR